MAQESPQPPEDKAKIVADGAHDGVDVVAETPFQEVAPQMSVGLAMTDDRFDGGPPLEFLFDLTMDAALLARTEDPEPLRSVMAHIALVHISALDLAPGERLGLLEWFGGSYTSTEYRGNTPREALHAPKLLTSVPHPRMQPSFLVISYRSTSQSFPRLRPVENTERETPDLPPIRARRWLDLHRKSGELPSHLSRHTFALHRTDAAQI